MKQAPQTNTLLPSNAAASEVVRSPLGRLATDLKGADLEALARFNQSLPQSAQAFNKKIKKPGEEEVTDELVEAGAEGEQWQVAQIDPAAVGGAVAEAGGAAGGAAAAEAAAAAAGAAEAGAGLAGAGAASAGMVAGPLAFAPGLLLVGSGSGDINYRPVLSLDKDTVYLTVNADADDISCAKARATDQNNDTVTFHFLVDGKRASVSANGFFAIDKVTGAISLTELGAEKVGSGDYDDDTASYTVDIVAFDGQVNSETKTLTIERTLPDLQSGDPDNLYNINELLGQGESHPDYVRGLVTITPHHDGDHDEDHTHIVINDSADYDYDKSFDILDMDITGDMCKLGAERDDHDLHLTFGPATKDGETLKVTVKNHFLANPDGGHPDASIEYIHFDEESSFAGYQLSGGPAEELASCDETFFPENGSYRLSTDVWTQDDHTLQGTNDKDLIAGSEYKAEILDGGKGNDLLFASGHGDTLIGGEGDDLLVLDHEDDGTVVFAAPADNGFDTVVNFDEDQFLDLNGDDLEVMTVSIEDGGDPLYGLLQSLDSSDISTGLMLTEGASSYFLVEATDATHLYYATDTSGDGVLQVGEFTHHMAQFYNTGLDAFSSDNVNAVFNPTTPVMPG